MSWGLLILTAFLVSCLLAAPAAAGIRRYIDSQGVIRISNTEPATPRQIQVKLPGAVASTPKTPKENASRPEAGPPLAAAPKLIPGEQESTPVAPEKSLPARSPEPPRAANLQPAADNREPARSPDTGTDPGPLPVQKVAYDPDADFSAPPLGPRAAAPPKPAPALEGGIRRFRDSQGVLVITNVAPAAKGPASSSQLAANDASPGKDFPEKQLDRPGTVPGAPNLRQVSWSPDQPEVAPLPAGDLPAGITAPVASGGIRRYRDKHGVMHIESVGPGTAASPSPPALQARAGPEEGEGPPEVAESKLTVQQAARSEVEEAKPTPALAAPDTLQAEIAVPEGVRRYRDRLGIWCIKSGDELRLPAAPPVPRLAAGPQEVLLAAVNMAARLPEINRISHIEAPRLPQLPKLSELAWAPGPAVPAMPAPPRKYGGITAVRDRQGRLVITNGPPPAGPGNGTSWALASAQLEPLVQEAAQAYNLPPALIRAVIKVESNFAHLAVSPKGAMGLMQLMPGTAADLGVQEPFNPRENIHGGCRYLRMLLDSFGGSLPLALAAYNAGPQRVVNSGYRVPEITETQNFLTQVMGRYLMEEKKAGRPWT